MTFSFHSPNWEPFLILPRTERPKSPRAITSKDGIGDRLRAAAFAEIQAYHAFIWAAETFTDAPALLRQNWKGLAIDEERHYGWLIVRMQELGIDPKERGVSDWLWSSLIGCKTAKEFAVFIASSEERGRLAGVRFCEAMMSVDPTSAAIFGRIAEEEIEHVRLAHNFFPDETKAQLAKDNPSA